MFAVNNVVDSSNYQSVATEIEKDSVVRMSFTKMLSTTIIKEMCAKYKISIVEFMKLRTYALSKIAVVNTNSFTMEVNENKDKKEGSFDVKVGEETSIYKQGVHMRAEVTPFRSLVFATAERIHAMVDATKEKVDVVPVSSTVPKAFQHSVLPIMQLTETMAKNNVDSSDKVKAVLEKEIMNEASNKPMVAAMVEAAPPKLKPDVKDSGKLRALTGVSTFDVDPKCNDEAKNKIIDIMARSPYPKSSYLNEYNNRHVFGFPISKSVYHYVGLVYDCDVPDEYKTIHVHSHDVKYALALSNKYPEKTVYYATSIPMGDLKAKLQGMRPEEMFAKTDGAFGVFVDYTVPPMEKGKDPRDIAKKIDVYDLQKAVKYKGWFRYLSIFSILETNRYKPSLVTSSAQVCQASHMDEYYFDNKKIIQAMAGILMHRYAYVWFGLPLCMVMKWFKSINGFKISLIMSKEQMKSLVSDAFSKFVDNVEDNMKLFDAFHDQEIYHKMGLDVKVSDIMVDKNNIAAIPSLSVPEKVKVIRDDYDDFNDEIEEKED